MDHYVEFMDDLRHMYLDNVVSGPVVDVLVLSWHIVLSSLAENIRCTYLNYVFYVLVKFVQYCSPCDSVVR